VKIAIIGGTGTMGRALGKRLSKSHEVIIGSRDPAKARAMAATIEGAKGSDYSTAASECDVAIVAIPFSAVESQELPGAELSGKLVISVINPMKFERGLFYYGLEKGSAAEILSARLPKSRVATAFNNISPEFLTKTEVPSLDVMVAADSEEIFYEVARIVNSVPNLRPLYAGPLSEAQAVERVTPLMLNLARKNRTGNLATRFVSQRE